jgi:uncharacterized protein (TIGR02145 family)
MGVYLEWESNNVTPFNCGDVFTDPRDGNQYETVLIGDQCWMSQNLKYLPQVSPAVAGSTIDPHYYVYNYNGTDVNAAKATDNYTNYGVLYNRPAAGTACPNGWLLASNAQWTALANFAGGAFVSAGQKLKSARTDPDPHPRWNSGGIPGTDDFGFAAFPGGVRSSSGSSGSFASFGIQAGFWTGNVLPSYRFMTFNLNFVLSGSDPNIQDFAYSVRCIKDEDAKAVNVKDDFEPFFTVYRDGESIAEVVGTNYTDNDVMPRETYCYSVTETPEENIETGFSNEICVEIVSLEKEIMLAEGWSGWSSFLDPMTDAMFADVVAPVVSDMIITQYFTNVFYPAYGINTMGAFSNAHGYVTKMSAQAMLTIEGMPVAPTVVLNAGWNLMPILVNCNLAAADVFEAIDGFIIAYEVAGDGIYYPATGVYTLETLMPGKAYWVKVDAATSFTFPACLPDAKASYVTPLRHANTTSWNDVAYTGLSHIVAFDENATMGFATGDVIGAFTSNGTLAGMTIVTDKGVSLTVFGEDITTAANDGFVEGEQLTYKLYRHANQTEYTLDVTYSAKAPNYDGLFANQGLSIIDNVAMTATGISTPELSGLTIYPNPSAGLFNVSVDNLSKNVNYVVMDAKGQTITQGRLAETQVIDLSDQPRGVYFIKFVGNDVLRIEKLVVK